MMTWLTVEVELSNMHKDYDSYRPAKVLLTDKML